MRPDSVAWNHGSLRSFKPGFESQPGRHLFLKATKYKTVARIPRLLIAVLFLSSILSPFANPDVDSDPYFDEDLIDKRLLLALENPEQSGDQILIPYE